MHGDTVWLARNWSQWQSGFQVCRSADVAKRFEEIGYSIEGPFVRPEALLTDERVAQITEALFAETLSIVSGFRGRAKNRI